MLYQNRYWIFHQVKRCDEHIGYYKDDLKHSGYDNTSLWYNPTEQQGEDQIEKQKREHKII